MSRKMSAYARKRLAQGKALGHTVQSKMNAGFSIMCALAASADREAPPPAGGEFLEGMTKNAQVRSEERIRNALASMLQSTPPADPDDVLATVDSALILGSRRTFEIIYGQLQPADDALVDISEIPEDARETLAAFQAGRTAWLDFGDRWSQSKQWGATETEAIDLQDAIDLAVAIIGNSTVQQMQIAYEGAARQILRMQRKGLI